MNKPNRAEWARLRQLAVNVEVTRRYAVQDGQPGGGRELCQYFSEQAFALVQASEHARGVQQ